VSQSHKKGENDWPSFSLSFFSTFSHVQHQTDIYGIISAGTISAKAKATNILAIMAKKEKKHLPTQSTTSVLTINSNPKVRPSNGLPDKKRKLNEGISGHNNQSNKGQLPRQHIQSKAENFIFNAVSPSVKMKKIAHQHETVSSSSETPGIGEARQNAIFKKYH
jgi:hypothetical protein